MTEILRPPAAQYLRKDAIRGGVDLLMLMLRSSYSQVDRLLQARQIGRAHHRVLYILSRRPGDTVSALRGTLNITKQSLARVLGDLLKAELVEMRPGETDRRTRLLFLTESGIALEEELFEPLHTNMARACAAAGEDAVVGYWTLMQHLIDPAARRRFVDFNG